MLTSWALMACQSQQLDCFLNRSPGHHSEKGLLCWDWGDGCGSSRGVLVGAGGWPPGPGPSRVLWLSGGTGVTTCRHLGGQKRAYHQVPHLPHLHQCSARMRAGIGYGTWRTQLMG